MAGSKLPKIKGADINFYVGQTYDASAPAQWNTWIKPPNCSLIFILCIGGGAGGGGGKVHTSVGAGGGGGGGSGGYASLLIPAALLPDTLYYQLGCSGIGGAVGVAGGNGTPSIVTIQPNTTNALYTVAISETTSATGGATASTTWGSGAAGGSGATIATKSQSIYSSLGIWQAMAGGNGGSGGYQEGSGTVLITGQPPPAYSGGGAGGGAEQHQFLIARASKGGDVVTAGPQFVLGGPAVTTSQPRPDGDFGFSILGPWRQYGGAGGGGNSGQGSPQDGGNGGSGAIGCGGGGGGGALGTPGVGNIGGPGMVLFAAW